jgi:hypothetical protein
MKKLCSITGFVTFLLFCTTGIMAQTTQAQLNQVDLMKKWIGSWKCEVSKDTTYKAEVKPFGDAGGYTTNWTSFVNGKLIIERLSIWGYDKKSDKYIIAELSKNTGTVVLSARWFTSDNSMLTMSYEFISNPEKALRKQVAEIKSPDLFTTTTFQNNKQGRTSTYTREKK